MEIVQWKNIVSEMQNLLDTINRMEMTEVRGDWGKEDDVEGRPI